MQNLLNNDKQHIIFCYPDQGGITCGAIDEPTKSSKAIDEHVIINFCDKNVAIARFCDKNVEKAHKSRQMQFHDKTAYVWGLHYRWDPSLSMNPVRRFAHFMPPCFEVTNIWGEMMWIVNCGNDWVLSCSDDSSIIMMSSQRLLHISNRFHFSLSARILRRNAGSRERILPGNSAGGSWWLGALITIFCPTWTK